MSPNILNYYFPQSRRLPRPLPFIFGVITFLIIILWVVIANAEEPDWNEIVPIIIQIESSGNPNAISEDNCRGLMQISEMVLKEYNQNYIRNYGNIPNEKFYYDLEDLFDPYINKRIGTWYLKRIWNHYLQGIGTIDDLLICYNFGYGNWLKYKQGKIKLPKETRNYLKHYK